MKTKHVLGKELKQQRRIQKNIEYLISCLLNKCFFKDVGERKKEVDNFHVDFVVEKSGKFLIIIKGWTETEGGFFKKIAKGCFLEKKVVLYSSYEDNIIKKCTLFLEQVFNSGGLRVSYIKENKE